MSKLTKQDETASGTVARVALLLRALAESNGDCGLGELAARMKLPASTTHRLLRLLIEQGFVERFQGSRTYRPGAELLRVAGLIASRAPLTNVARGHMQAVVDACDETCVLSVYLPTRRAAMVAAVVHGSHPLRYEATLHVPGSLCWGATGLGILAFLPAPIIDDIVAVAEPSPATGKPVNPAQLRRELAVILKRGYALTRGQKITGAVGMSAPIFDSSGAIAALCLTLPDSRYASSMERRFARILKDQASRLSNTLGGRGGSAPD
jgi:DNA-binding IclR family transcriptional regulator